MKITAHSAYLGLGSSLGDRPANLRTALNRLEQSGECVRVVQRSGIYETPHRGRDPLDSLRYPPHLNCVARVETTLTPEALLERIRRIEAEGGRTREIHWGPRTIDIDILLYDALVRQTPELTLPHPGIAERAFVLAPLREIAPRLCLPDGRAVADLASSPAVCAQEIRLLPTGL